jgi:hypothetical protein
MKADAALARCRRAGDVFLALAELQDGGGVARNRQLDLDRLTGVRCNITTPCNSYNKLLNG